jgi:hypothetical protein
METVILRIAVENSTRTRAKPKLRRDVFVQLEKMESVGDPIRVRGRGDRIPKSLILAPGKQIPAAVAALNPKEVAAVCDCANWDPQQVQHVGEYLYWLLLRASVGKEWRRRREQAPGRLRTILEFDNSPEVASLRNMPWELIYDPNSDGGYLFLSAMHPMSRATSLARREPGEDWPLRVLVVNGADPLREDSIGAQMEVRVVERLFAKARADVEYEFLEYPTPDAILRACQQIRPHIFHFIGHSEASHGGTDHRLYLHQNASGGTQLAWDLNAIRAALTNMEPPRLAILNACRTSKGPGSGARALPAENIASAFLRNGSLAVIGMQGDIEGDLAAAFAGEFYQQILLGTPLDVAVANSRLKLLNCRPTRSQSEWALPVLKTRTRADLILPRRPPTHTTYCPSLRFVDRVPQRLKLRDILHSNSAAGPAPTASLSVVLGDGQSGKSHFAEWCSHMCQWRGLPSAYVQFAGDTVDLIGALRWIRDGRRPEPGRECRPESDWPLAGTAFRRFNWELKWQLEGKLPPSVLPEEPAEIIDPGRLLNPNTPPQEHFIANALQHFRGALETAAQPNGLVLFLDHLERVERTALTQWLPQYLLSPIAEGKIAGVRAVLVLRKEDFEDPLQGLRRFIPATTVIELGLLNAMEFPWLARNLCLQWSEEIYEEVFSQLTKLSQTGPWPAGRLLAVVDKLCNAFDFARRQTSQR